MREPAKLGSTPCHATSRWLIRFERPATRLRLICFPYAGAGASLFREWPTGLPIEIEVVAVQLPGREGRFGERLRADIHWLAREIGEALVPLLDRPLAFFGHSLGAAVAYETALHLERVHAASPVALFASSREAPTAPHTQPPIYQLGDEQFLEELRRLNGIPAEVLANRELCAVVLPTLRADMQISDTYSGSPAERIAAPIVALAARDDVHVALNAVEQWRERTTAEFRLMMVPGDHFYLHNHRALLLRVLAARLLRR